MFLVGFAEVCRLRRDPAVQRGLQLLAEDLTVAHAALVQHADRGRIGQSLPARTSAGSNGPGVPRPAPRQGQVRSGDRSARRTSPTAALRPHPLTLPGKAARSPSGVVSADNQESATPARPCTAKARMEFARTRSRQHSHTCPEGSRDRSRRRAPAATFAASLRSRPQSGSPPPPISPTSGTNPTLNPNELAVSPA